MSLLQIEVRPSESLCVISEVSEAAVAVEAQHAAHASRLVIVIHVFGGRPVTDRALVALLPNQILHLDAPMP